LNNKIVLLSLSLIIAFALFYVVDKRSNIIINKSADILYNQKVTALYNEEAYVIEGLPDKVDITLIGRQSDLYLAKQYPAEDVTVDLRELKPGTHKVAFQYSRPVSSVEYKLDPSTVSVIIYEKVSQSERITSEILHLNKLPAKYSISGVELTREEVYVKGAKYKLEEVALVKAMIDVENIVNLTVGKAILKDVPLIAYDAQGNKMDVEIVPAVVDATITVKSPEKKVPLKVIPEGEVVFGKAIDSMTLSKDGVTIYGDQEALDDITYIPVKIDVSKLSENKEYNITLSKPTGVKDMSISSVTVKVTLADIKESTVEGISIAPRNLNGKYSAQALTKEDATTDVIVKGTENSIKSINKENISAYVDLSGLGEGTHEVTVNITGDDLKLSYVAKTKTVKIVIKKNE